MPLPNLVNAGVTKAGTTSLMGYLEQHPEVCVADRKDLNRWSSWRFGEAPTQPLEEFAEHFAHCTGQPIRVDVSPDYFTGGVPLVTDLDRELPGVRAVIVLRDPVARLWSSYTYKKSRGALPPDATFGATLDADLAAMQSDHDLTREGQHHRTLRTGRYVEHLAAWFDVLGRDRVHVLFLENLRDDAVAELKHLCAWLGIDQDAVDRFETGPRNPTVQPRSQALRRLAERVNASADAVLRRVPRAEARLRQLYARLNAAPSPERFSEADRARVTELYAPSTEALRNYLAQQQVERLPGWLRD